MLVSTYLRTLAVLLAFACVAACEAKPPLHEATFRMETGIGLCSATAVGPHVVMSAAHCVTSGTQRIALNGQASDVVSMVGDGQDHVLIRTTLTFRRWVGQGRALKQGDPVQFWGNPDGIFDVMRHGTFAGVSQHQTEDWPDQMPAGFLLFVIEGTHGDSGAGILDSHGNLVAVVSGGYTAPDGFRLMYSLPILFTPSQWREAQS